MSTANKLMRRIGLSTRNSSLTRPWTHHLHPSLASYHSSSRLNNFHFDTHHFVQRLEREGLTRAQSEGIMASMADVIEESIRNLTQNMVSKSQQEKVRCSPCAPWIMPL
jgi:hypothetical protein